MINAQVLRVDRHTGVSTARPVSDLPELLKDPDCWVWFDVLEPDDEAAAILRDDFGLHPLAVQDCLERNHVPRVHVYKDYLFLVLHRPHSGQQGHVHYLEIDQFIASNFLVTVHGPRNPAVQLVQMLTETDETAERMLRGTLHPTSPMALSYRIVSGLTNGEERFINNLAREVGLLEQQVMAHKGDANPQAFLEELFRARHALLTVRTMTAQSAEIYGRAARLVGDGRKDNHRLLTDLRDQYTRLERISHSQLEFLEGVTEYYRARTDTKMTIAAERLAVIAAVTLPATAISSILGMNVIVSPETEWWPLTILLALMFGLSLVLLRWAKRQGWW